MEISTKGKVSIPGDTARADEAFGPFPSPTRLPSLHDEYVFHKSKRTVFVVGRLVSCCDREIHRQGGDGNDGHSVFG